MKLLSIFSALPLSFFSKSLYRSVGQHWRGLGLLYLLLLAVLTWAPYSYFINLQAQDFLSNRAPQLLQQIPTLHVINGKLATAEKKPYFIKDPKTDRLIVIIDTSGRYTTLENTNAAMLVTSNGLLYRDSQHNVSKQPLLNLEDGQDYIDPAKLAKGLNASPIKEYFMWICLAVGSMAYFLLYVVQALLCSIVGALFASSVPTHYPFSRIFRLCVVALTPVAIISTVLFIYDISFPYMGLVKVIVTLCYVYFAIKANALVTDIK